ncbi:hypothetical protein Bca52824_003469 [Brassica carinata]|uniref:Uncharacterized protein n=1 Tax=Brassica carinata TaxID=52824 RepID=A0A8X8BBG7_BRACI|nr:hypothetical protein Bca52824_003469 [Brassica carinata]
MGLDLGWIPEEKSFKEAKGLHQHAIIVCDSNLNSKTVCLWWENDRRSLSEAGVRHSSWEEADGFRYRQPWVTGVQEQIESLTKRLEEAEQLLNMIPTLKNQVETLEAQAKGLTRQVDRLTAEVYNLTVQVADLEELCFE